MAFSGSTYVQVTGATTAAAGQTIQSAVWNNIHQDMGTALTEIMSQLVATPTNRNIMWMNGGLEVWQRGAGSSSNIGVAASNTAYTADRWYITTGVNQAYTIAAATGLTNQSQLCAKVQRNAAQTGTTAMVYGYPLDTDEIIRMRGKLVSFSCVVLAGANWSPTSGTLTVALYTGTGSVAKRGGGFTGETTILTISTNLTAGGAVTSIAGNSSVVIPTTATQAELQFTWTPTGTAGAIDSFSVDDVQLEVQNSATTWTPSNYDRLPFTEMQHGCKRHYQKTFEYSIAASAGTNNIQNALSAAAVATQRFGCLWIYPVEMRTTPTITTYIPFTGSSANWYDYTASVSVAVNVAGSTDGTKAIYINSTTSGSTTNDVCFLHAQADAGI